jgi:hypothetical protein
VPRRELFTSAEWKMLLAFRGEESELLRHYSFSTHKFAVIRGRRDDHNRLRLRSNFVTSALPVGCSLLTRFLIRPFWVSNST